MMNQRLQRMAAYLLARAKEPSSWAGIAGLASLMHRSLSLPEISFFVGILVGIANLLAILFPELKEPKE